MKKRILNLFAVAAVALSSVSCEQFLTVEPIDKMSADTYFKNELELELFANGMINSYLPTADGLGYSDKYSDLTCSKTSTDYYRPGIWNAQKQGSWDVGNWRNIRRANIFLAGIDRAKENVSEDVYKHYQGVARLWRAYFYLSKVQTFGDVPWFDHALDVEDEALYAPQDDREYVMHKVLEDLNFACENLGGDSKYVGVVNKWVALAFKSRVCLYEGTFRKYHSVNPSTQKAWTNEYESANDFLTECVNASKELIEKGGFSLCSDYYTLFHDTNLAGNSEAIWWSDYDGGELNRMHELTWVVNSGTYDQQSSPTKLLLNHYLTLDGTPVTHEGKVGYLKEFENRDKRLKATVHYDGYTYTTTAGQEVLKQIKTGNAYNGYHYTKFSIEKEENFSKGKNDNDYPILRLGEVLLNYAEAAAELGQMNETLWNSTIGALRARAGVKNIYPGSAGYKSDWTKAYYGNLSDVITEIRRERAVELIVEGLRVNDLYRWKLGHLIVDRGTNNQGWLGIYVNKTQAAVDKAGAEAHAKAYAAAEDKAAYIAANGEKVFSINGYFYSFKGAPGADLGYNVGTSTANQNHTFSEGDHGFVTYNYKLEWNERNYVRPIPQSALNVNKNLKQNVLWEGI